MRRTKLRRKDIPLLPLERDPIDQSGSRLVGDEVVVEEHRLEGFVSQFAVNETINKPTSEAGDDICEILT
jgi:hypothetical protein